MGRKLFLMKCGHVASAVDELGEPVCAICAGVKSGAFEIERECETNEGLEHRKAKCTHCGAQRDSQWTLPFFEHRKDQEYDYYYCGNCFGFE